jgi:tetratricopeptide (TPR) repeat protein
MTVNFQVGTRSIAGIVAIACTLLSAHAALAYINAPSQLPKGIQIAPLKALNRYQQGLEAVANGDLLEAIANFDRAIKLDPRYFQAYIERGNVKDALLDLPGAIDDFTMAISIDPKSAPAYYNRATVLGKSGRRQLAIADYNMAILIDPQYAQAYVNRGNELDDLGDTKGAIDSYNKALAIRPNYALAILNRGIAYGRSGNRRRAIVDIQQAANLFKATGNLDRYNRALKMIADLQQKQVKK